MKRISEFARKRPSARHYTVAAAMMIAVAMPLSTPLAAPYVVFVADSKASDVPHPHAGEVDPVITGKTIGAGQRAEWEKKRKKFLECGLCGKEQAFPEALAGDL
ncbi:hypothetical protein [Salaquimonas pukyongi]|uniref:hypothetical protein n=1 Tax=Salaquimonas pukyongi TaxID=2712698 RepID=UPI00096B8316|nr:hypothetical protein [Salaquimonas pukyongi]